MHNGVGVGAVGVGAVGVGDVSRTDRGARNVTLSVSATGH